MAPPESTPEAGSLKARLAAEMRDAMKARERVRLSALRLLSAAVKNREVELRHPLSDEEFVEVAVREVKRRREAIESYEQVRRPDRAAQEREEADVLSAYVPEGLSDDEVTALIEEAIAETGASGPGDFGKAMGYVMARAKGRVDGKTVQTLVRARLDA
ncbi:MAG: GatB/YqeY domain-containing protein [Actinomycetota bacterium]